MAVSDAYVFPGFLTPVLTQLFFPKPPTTFLTCFCRGERRKYAEKKSRFNHQVMSPTRSQLSYPGGANWKEDNKKVPMFISCFPEGYREIVVKIFYNLTLVPPEKIQIFMFLLSRLIERASQPDGNMMSFTLHFLRMT